VKLTYLGGLRAGLGAVLSLCAFALAASPALADGADPAYPGSTLHVTTTGPLVARQPLTIVATGTNAPFDTPIDYGLRLFAIDHKLLTIPCAQGFSMEETIWEDNSQAGRLLTFEDLSEGLSGPSRHSKRRAAPLLARQPSPRRWRQVWKPDVVRVQVAGVREGWDRRPRIEPEPDGQAARPRRRLFGDRLELDRERDRQEPPVQDFLTSARIPVPRWGNAA
jgi:hypothetical protein